MEIFTLPFMQKAFIAGIVLGTVLPFLGVFATLKRMSFFGDGVAHASLAGVAVGVLAGVHPFGVALLVGILFGIGTYILERKTTLASDAVIGTLFTAGLALGIIILNLKPGYQPELMGFLFGNILAVSASDILLIGILGALIFAFLLFFMRPLVLMVFNREAAWVSGVRTDVLEFLFYIILPITVVLGVKLLGIILVSALLVAPPTTAKLIARSFKELVIFSIIGGEISIIAGLIFSYILDVPSGAAIVLTGTLLFLFVLIIKRFFVSRSQSVKIE